MKLMKHVKVRGLCLAVLCMMAVFAIGAAGSASAAPLLFIPESNKFPYHLAGTAGKSELEQKGGITNIVAQKVDVLALVLSPTLFNARFTFLEVSTASLGGKCNNEGSETSNTILLNILGHLGFSHLPGGGEVPAVLLLLPNGLHFTCFGTLGGNVLVLVKGNVIGQILSPKLNVLSEELLIAFAKSAAGTQLLRSFLLGGQNLQTDLLSSTSEGSFELAAQLGEGTLKALPGEGGFFLLSP